MTAPESSTPDRRPADEHAESARHREAVDQFVTFWGRMASNWGINRTMAQVYALLYCAGRPLNTDEIMERLQISRGSANMNLRAIVDWDLAEKTRVPDSRKDHYVAETDVWTVTARIIEKREQQEVRPVREHLQGVADRLVPDDQSLDERPPADRRLYQRLQRLADLIETFEQVTEALLPLVKAENEPLLRRLAALARSLDAADPPDASGECPD
jgi:DNA-binding transcriptional regulator GbsR (MarR family)